MSPGSLNLLDPGHHLDRAGIGGSPNLPNLNELALMWKPAFRSQGPLGSHGIPPRKPLYLSVLSETQRFIFAVSARAESCRSICSVTSAGDFVASGPMLLQRLVLIEVFPALALPCGDIRQVQ